MPNVREYQVGNARVFRVEDCAIDAFTPKQLLPEWSFEDEELLAAMPETVDGAHRHLLLSIHSWVIQIGAMTVIVDTGAGNDKSRPYASYFDHLHTPYLARLAAAGVAPAEVDYVLHTHLHVDHVGWNTRLVDGRWVPTFPNARHVFSSSEYAYFTDPANLSERNRTSFQVQADSVAPIVEAGMAEQIVVDGREKIQGLSFHSTPGHTHDHASILLESAGERAIFAGDVLHHPIQVARPDLMSVFDPVRERTLASRGWALDFAADHEAIFFSSHFPSTGAGRVSKKGKGWAWTYV